MRKVFFSTLLGIALATTGCKKENKEAAPAAGSAAPAAGSAAAGGEKTAEPTAPAGDTAPTAIAPGEPAAPAADPGPRPASITDADVAMAEKLVGAIEKMAGNLNEAGTDCAKFATAIKSSASEMSAVMEEGKKFDERLKADDAAKKWFEATYAPKVMGTMGKLMTNPCINDKAVQEAMASAKMM